MIMRKNIWERLQLLREQARSHSPMSLHHYQSALYLQQEAISKDEDCRHLSALQEMCDSSQMF